MTENATIRVGDLREADVLLSYGVGGTGSVAYWAKTFDGGAYSHAAYCTGASVIEAVSPKARETDLELHLEEHVYVDVYRFDRDGQQLDPGSITRRAREYVGADYATPRLGTIALLVGLGRLSGVPAFHEFLVSPFGDALAKDVREQRESRKLAMICSQLVASAFYESTPDHRYALSIRYEPGRLAAALDEPSTGAPAATGDREFDDLVDACHRAFVVPPSVHAPATLGAVGRELAAGEAIRLTRVTPADLERSPTLTRVGRLVG